MGKKEKNPQLVIVLTGVGALLAILLGYSLVSFYGELIEAELAQTLGLTILETWVVVIVFLILAISIYQYWRK